MIDKYLNNEQITAENLAKELNAIGNNVKIDNYENGNYIATFVDTNHTYKIEQNGNIEQLS